MQKLQTRSGPTVSCIKSMPTGDMKTTDDTANIDVARAAALVGTSCIAKHRAITCNVAGVTFHKADIAGLLAACRRKPQHIVTTRLVLEPSNPYDEHAIRVEIDDISVGYVPRALTDRVRRRLRPDGVIRTIDMSTESAIRPWITIRI